MPATTPKLALPYPVAADTADVPRDMLALATKLDGFGALQPAFVTALPGSPADGQEVYYQNAAMAALGIVWHLRYRGASGSGYKWEFIGGLPLRDYIPAGENAPVGVADTFSDAATPGPSLTAPLAGEYDVGISAYLQSGAAANVAVFMSFANGAITAKDVDSISIANGAAAPTGGSVSRVVSGRAVASGALVRAKYRTNSGTLGIALYRLLTLTPVRVG